MPKRSWKHLVNPDFRGWRVVLAGATMSALISVSFVQGYGQYAVVIREEFGWDKTRLALGFAISRAIGGAIGPAQGWALTRFGVRPVMRVGVVLLSGGLIGFSRIQNATQFFSVLICMALGSSLSGFVPVTTAVVQWFERQRSKALSLGSLGFAVGGSLSPVLAASIEQWGWRATSVGSGVIYFLIAMPLVATLHGTPSDFDQHVDGVHPESVDKSQDAEGVSERHFSAKEAMATRAFWLISLGHASALLVVGAVLAHLPLYLTEDRGMSFQNASYVVGALPLIQIVGMLAGGQLGDRMKKRFLASGAMLGHMVALLALVYLPLTPALLVFVPLHAISWGTRGPLMQAMRADYFGSTSFGQIMGISSAIVVLGMFGGPVIAGYLADRTGNYDAGFTVLALAAGLGMSFFVTLRPPRDPDSTSENVKKAVANASR